MYLKPKIFQQFPELIAVESNRKDGISKVPYASLNLGLFTDDKPENVQENRERFFSKSKY